MKTILAIILVFIVTAICFLVFRNHERPQSKLEAGIKAHHANIHPI